MSVGRFFGKLEGLGYCDLDSTQHPFGGIDTKDWIVILIIC